MVKFVRLSAALIGNAMSISTIKAKVIITIFNLLTFIDTFYTLFFIFTTGPMFFNRSYHAPHTKSALLCETPCNLDENYTIYYCYFYVQTNVVWWDTVQGYMVQVTGNI